MLDTLLFLSWFVFAAAFFLVLLMRGRLFLLYFQQEEYDERRFLRWLVSERAIDRKLTFILALGVLIAYFVPAGVDFVVILAAAAGAFWIRQTDARFLAEAKKPLAMTKRATRIYFVYGLLAWIAFVAVLAMLEGAAGRMVGSIALIQFAPVLMVLANLILTPFEKRIQRGFLDEARDKAARLDPYTIGITGSYGKTSTKMILEHVLKAVAPTVATPGSVNTPMGISRFVREKLGPEHKYFIAEMGAYGPGSIARLCDLTPPKLSLLTAVGMAHYERFKSVDTVFRAKMEIAESARERGGRTVLNVDMIPERLLKPEIETVGRAHYILVGEADGPYDLDYTVTASEQTREGLKLTIRDPDGASHDLKAPIFGLHQVGNIAVTFATARTLGVPAEAIVTALKTVPQIKHRLEVQTGARQPTIIDDGYNSNPTGFRAALDLLDLFGTLKSDEGRRILITPGMVELGEAHEREHESVGAYAADKVDIVLALQPERLGGFLKGLEEAAGTAGPQIIRMESQAEAEAWIRAHARSEDAILFENSLPDLYERHLRL